MSAEKPPLPPAKSQAPSKKNSKVRTLVLTGGPCAGKTTALAGIKEHYKTKGVNVYLIPEVPTLFLSGGHIYPGPYGKGILEFELGIMNIQKALEDNFRAIADAVDGPCLIVCDRATMDIKAYLPPDVWQKVLDAGNMNEEGLLDRYDAVVHLQSTAEGLASAYTTENNEVRRESINSAIRLNESVENCWKTHSQYISIGCFENFAEKLSSVTTFTDQLLGL